MKNNTAQKLTKRTNPTLWNEMTRKGAPKPLGSCVWWNDWAANNPQPEAKALLKVDVTGNITPLLKAIATGARPIER
jgi:hypothetical protein